MYSAPVCGNKYLWIISDKFTKLTKSALLKNTFASKVAKPFVHKWVPSSCAPRIQLADTKKCRTIKFFWNVCDILNIQNLITTIYHLHKNGKAERFSHTLKVTIPNNLDDHPTDRDLYTLLYIFADDCISHTSTTSVPFKFELSEPSRPLALRTQSREYTSAQTKFQLSRGEDQMQNKAQSLLGKSRRRYR